MAGSEESVAEGEDSFLVVPSTKFEFIASSYRVVFSLDISQSMAAVCPSGSAVFY